jgi:membrane protein YdbS with pleckstrin-like domain
MSGGAASWVYRGIWGILASCFKVPLEPPTIPFHDSATIETFRPARAFLSYLRLQFWLAAGFFGLMWLGFWIILVVLLPLVGLLILLPVALAYGFPYVLAFIAIHLRYDSTWYVLTDRSLRIRRGIWTIRETTITFENIQNVTVNQGPLQRLFGISDVIVQTAGGGAPGPHGEQTLGPHAGILEGLADAPRIRDVLLARLKASRTAGLGDEAHPAILQTWGPEHLAVLREIRDRAAGLVRPA